MKKVLSGILVGAFLISTIGAVSVFAKEPDTTATVAVEKIAESQDKAVESSLKDRITMARDYVADKFELIKKEVSENKFKYAKVAGGFLAAATVGAATYFVYNYMGTKDLSAGVATNVTNATNASQIPQGSEIPVVDAKAVQQAVDAKVVQQAVDAKVVQQAVDAKAVQQAVDAKAVQQAINAKAVQQAVDAKQPVIVSIHDNKSVIRTTRTDGASGPDLPKSELLKTTCFLFKWVCIWNQN